MCTHIWLLALTLWTKTSFRPSTLWLEWWWVGGRCYCRLRLQSKILQHSYHHFLLLHLLLLLLSHLLLLLLLLLSHLLLLLLLLLLHLSY